MRWTKRKPYVQGWYWYRDKKFSLISVLVEWVGDEGHRNLAVTWPKDPLMTLESEGEWAGLLFEHIMFEGTPWWEKVFNAVKHFPMWPIS